MDEGKDSHIIEFGNNQQYQFEKVHIHYSVSREILNSQSGLIPTVNTANIRIVELKSGDKFTVLLEKGETLEYKMEILDNQNKKISTFYKLTTGIGERITIDTALAVIKNNYFTLIMLGSRNYFYFCRGVWLFNCKK